MKNNYIKSERMWNVCLTYVYRMFIVFILLFTLGIGQSWADPWTKNDVSTGSQGTKTVGDKLNGGSDWWYNYRTNGGWSTGTDIQVLIGTSTSSYSAVDASWYGDDGDNKKVHANIGSFTFDKSGIWYAVGKYKSGSTTAYTSGTDFSNNTSLSTSMSTSNSPYWTVNPPAVKSGTISVSATNTAAGSGTGLTSGSPIILVSGMSSTFTITATQNVSDANSALYCKFAGGSYSTTNTYNIASGTEQTNQTLALKVKYRNNGASLDGSETTTTIYYKWAAPTPTILMTSVTPSSSIVAGNDITLVGTRANSSNMISFQYTTNDGGSWTDITPKTSSLSSNVLTATWTIPDTHGVTQTFKFRAKLAEATPIYSSKSDGVTVYNTKTIHVKNSNNWANLYIHAWGASGDLTSWPGVQNKDSHGLSCTNVGGGLWWNVVITSQVTGFLLDCNSSGDANQTADLSYSSYTHDRCYAIGTNSGKRTLSNTTVSCLTDASVSTSSVTMPTVNDRATIGGNVTGLGNDRVTSYGYYYSSTNSSLAGDNLTGSTRVEVGTNKTSTGTYSKTQTGLTGGKTYYVIAYATNGNGTVYGSRVSFTTPYKVTLTNPTGGTFSSSGTKYVSSTLSVSITATTGYTFSSWSASGCTMTSTSTTSGVTTATLTPTADNATLTANYTENSYSTNVSVSPSGKGSISSPTPSDNKINVKQVTGTAVTASPNTNYIFTSWSKTGGGLTVSSTTTNPATFKATSAGGTITANFADQWNVKSDQWDNWDTYKGLPNVSSNTFRQSFTLPAKTTYHFKVVKRVNNNGSNDVWYGVNGGKTLTRGSNSVTGLEANGGGTEYITFTTDAAGTYTITYVYNASVASMSVTVGYPTAYTIQFGSDGHGKVTATATSAGGSMTSGDYVASGDVVTFAQTPNTGYTLKGWYTTAGGSTSAGLNGDNQLTINAAKTVYAQYNAKTYNITLDQQTDTAGYRASGSTNLTATYDAAFPSITTPTAQDGWAFMGYWSEARGKGTQFTDKDGALLADIENYSDASGHWKYDGTKTLYAYYKKAEITGITFSTAGVPGSVIAPSTSTTATATISPTPTGTTTICWRILHSNGNPLEEQPTFDPETGAAVSFTTSATSGSYLIEARLRLGSGCSGTVLDSVTAVFQVAGDHDVTVQYKDASGNTIKASETVTGRPLAWSDDITAPDIFGYTFARWDAGDGVTIKNGDFDPVTTSTDATIKIKAIYDGRLTAVYNQKSIIYFKNTLEWGSVYVNFYGENGYWDDKGSGNKTVAGRNKEMTQIDGTDIWYFDYGAAGITATKWVSFTEDSQNGNGDGSQNFWKTGTGENVVYPARRGDDLADKATATGFYAKTPMFVPLETQTPKVKNSVNSGQANYYNDGYWTKYTPGTGYTLEIYDNYDASPTIKTIAFSGDGDLMPMTAVADLEAGKTYRFQLKRDADVYYGNNGTMTYANHGQDTPWEMSNEAKRRNDANTADVFAMCKINTTAAGNYTFHLTYSPNGSGVNRLRMAVDYPVAQGDYRLLYKDNVHTLWHPSAVIPSVKAKDTVSFFVRKGKAAYLKLQKCTGLGDGTVTWSDTVTWWNGSSLPAAVTKDSIYNICLKHNASTGKLEIENVEGYSGNYYIRTDAANSKWDNYRSDPDHLMTYSEYSITHGGYSHYYCHWVTTADAYRKNVKFVIANDYSPCISDTLIRETVAGDWAKIDKLIDEYGTLLRSANVRFMWNIADNTIKRAYLDPAKNDDNFLVLSSADSKIANASEVVQTAVVFSDNENWIYEANVKAKPNAQIKLIATWGAGSDSIVQYFKGTSSTTETLITGSGDNWYNIRLIYDYKTNRLVSALLPSGNITTETPINADVMFIREHQGDIAQLTFSGSGSLTEIKTAYGVIRFNKWTLNNKEKTGSHTPLASPLSRYERDLFYISFPFRVNLNEVFGFGTYGVHWIIEEYDGAARAANGLWKDTPSYWRFITNRRGKYLEPNVGYLLALDLDELGESSSVWNNDVENVELFFPSCDGMSTITSSSVTHTLPQHECTINRPTPQGDRRISDSHWNIMSVPTYVNVNNPSFTNSTWKATIGPKFLYTWNADDNTLTPTTAAGFNYHAMHAYTVQYYGNVTWTSSVSPSSIVARKQTEPSAYEWCLELQQNDKMIDRTYVRMSDEEEVTTGFEFGYDMSKSIEWAKANIYTFIGTEWVAGNSLPLETEQTTIIPVGLTLAAAGDYTFAMPAGTHGVGVTLVDTQTNERTNLSAGMTQTVTLTQGDHLDRFFLEISPIHNTPTNIGEVTGNGLPANGARKVLIDGILYIVKGDKLYDVRGTMIK